MANLIMRFEVTTDIAVPKQEFEDAIEAEDITREQALDIFRHNMETSVRDLFADDELLTIDTKVKEIDKTGGE